MMTDDEVQKFIEVTCYDQRGILFKGAVWNTLIMLVQDKKIEETQLWKHMGQMVYRPELDYRRKQAVNKQRPETF